MLDIHDLSFSYSKRKPLISGLSLKVQNGCVCGLLGKNGVGKTTLLYLICGLLKPAAGSVDYDGFNPFDRKPDFLRDIFLLPEEFSLPPVTIRDFVKVNAPFYPKFSHEIFGHCLQRFDIDENMHLAKISMGQKKKAFISFALACNTGLLLLDEPTNGLDITAKRVFRQLVAEVMTDDRSIIISTHQVYDVDKILDHVLIIDNDSVKLNASIPEITEKYRFFMTSDRNEADAAIVSLEVPGGYNVATLRREDEPETEVNLETLFEMSVGNRIDKSL